MAAPKKYPDELRERAVQEVAESGRPIAHVARDLGIHPEALRNWVRQDEADHGERPDRAMMGAGLCEEPGEPASIEASRSLPSVRLRRVFRRRGR